MQSSKGTGAGSRSRRCCRAGMACEAGPACKGVCSRPHLAIHADRVGVGLPHKKVHEVAVVLPVCHVLQQVHQVARQPLPPKQNQ